MYSITDLPALVEHQIQDERLYHLCDIDPSRKMTDRQVKKHREERLMLVAAHHQRELTMILEMVDTLTRRPLGEPPLLKRAMVWGEKRADADGYVDLATMGEMMRRIGDCPWSMRFVACEGLRALTTVGYNSSWEHLH